MTKVRYWWERASMLWVGLCVGVVIGFSIAFRNVAAHDAETTKRFAMVGCVLFPTCILLALIPEVIELSMKSLKRWSNRRSGTDE